MVLLKRASTSLVGIVLTALAIFVVVPKLNEATERIVSVGIGTLRSQVESFLGLSLSFQALSPSILRSASFTNLAVSAPGGRRIVSARKVTVRYDLLALLRGKDSQAFTGLDLDDVTIDARLPEDQAVIDRLAALLRGGSAESAAAPTSGNTADSRVRIEDLPRITISGKNVSAKLMLDGWGAASFEARTASFSTSKTEPTVSLSGKFSVDSAVLGLGEISGPVEVSGSLSQDFQRARLSMSVAAVSREISLSTQRFVLVYGDGLLSLTKVKDRAPLDAAVRVDFGGGRSSLSLRLDGYAPSRSLTLAGRFASLEPWLEMPYSGSLSIDAPGSDLSKATYTARLSGWLPARFFPGNRPNARAELAVRGDTRSMEVERARLELGDDVLEYSGSFNFADLAPDGTIDARLSLAEGKLDFSSSMKVFGHAGEYTLLADQASLGGVVFKDIALSASRKGDQADFKLSLRPPSMGADLDAGPSVGNGPSEGSTAGRGFSGEVGATTGMPLISCEGSVAFSRSPDLELSLELEALDLQPLKPILAVLMDSPEAAALVSSLKLGGSLFASSDFSRLSWTAPDLTVVSSAAPGAYALLSLSGTTKTLAVKHLLVSASGYSVEGTGMIDYSEAGRLGFEANLSLKDIPYAMKGSVEGQGISISGDYGLELIARTVDRDTYVSAKAKGLPLPIAGGLFLATVTAEGRFSSPEDWKLGVAEFELVPAGEKVASIPKISLAGDFGPTRADLGYLRVADKVSSLSGSAKFDYSFAKPLTVHAVARIAADAKPAEGAKVAPTAESYAIDASYSDGKIDAVADMVASPLVRFGNLPITGSADGMVSAKGAIESPKIGFNLKLRDGRYLDQTLALAASGDYVDGALELGGVSGAYQGQAISKGSGRFSFVDASAAVALDFAGNLNGANVAFSLSASGSSLASGSSNLGDMLASYAAKGILTKVSIGGASTELWPFSATIDQRSIAFVGGSQGEVRFKYQSAGSFSASLQSPFPVIAEVSGLYDGKNVDLSVQGIDFDVGLLNPLMPPDLIHIVSGRARGGFRAVGLANDPEISGEIDLDNASVKIIGWLADDIGPFKAPIIAEGRKVSVSVPSAEAGSAAIAMDCQATFDQWLPTGLTASVRTLERSRVRLDSIILGIHAQGAAAADLRFAVQGDVLSIDSDVTLDKGTVVVTPETLSQTGGNAEEPQIYLAVATNVHFGRGVQVFFPYINYPVVSGFSDPSSLLSIRYDQSTEDFTLKGNVTLRGGQVFYIQRNFFIKNGTIVFNENSTHFDPRVTLLAELRDSNNGNPVVITLRADNAPIATFQPRLSSDPPMSEAQIALLMGQNLVGATASNGLSGVNSSDALRKAIITTSDLAIPQLNVTRTLENNIRDTLGLDMFYFNTQILQNWLYDISSPQGNSLSGDALSRYFDQTQLYAGKYLNDLTFAHASLNLIANPLAGSSTLPLTSSLGLGVNLEFGVELDSPFGHILWNIDPKSLGSRTIIDQSLSLSWRLAF